MKQKSLFKNSIYNFVYTGLNLFFPLITSPYVSVVLGAENLGKVNFATNISNWFIIFAAFGTTTYGIREVAKNRDDNEKLGKVFSEIFFINGIVTVLSSLIFLISINTVPQFIEEKNLYLIIGMNVILNVFTIDWFFQGIEEYRYITIRSLVVKVISIMMIFLLVKNSTDYPIYALITVLSLSGNGIMNYFYSKKFVKISFKQINIKRHFSTLKVFFSTNLIVNIYANIDQTILGFLGTSVDVAFMTRGKMVVRAASSVNDSISHSTMSRASYYSENDKDKFLSLMNFVPKIIIWIGMPMMIGIIVLSKEIMLLLGGTEFINASYSMMLITPIIIFSSLSSFLQRQILIPYGFEKDGLNASIISSVISIVLNFVLIRSIGIYGAAIALVVSEFSAFVIRFLIIKYKRDFTNLSIINKSTIRYLVSGLIMAIVILLVKPFIRVSILIKLPFLIITGIVVYVSLQIIAKDEVTEYIIMKITAMIKNIRFKNKN